MADAGAEMGSSFEIADGLEILERRKWWFVVAIVCGLLIGGALTVTLPAHYESNTTILVEPQRVPESFVRSTVTLEVRQRLSTLRERVTSFSSLNELIDQIGEDRIDTTGLLTREELMNKIRKNLDVELKRGGDSATVVEISYGSADPEAAAAVVRAIADLFISENIKDRAQQATATADFLDRELARLRDEVTRQEDELRAFRANRMGSLPSQLETNLRSLDRLNLELSANLEAQVATSQRIALLERQASPSGMDGEGGPAAPTSLVGALTQARQQLIVAQGIYTDEHPNVQHLKDEIARLEEVIENAPEVPPDVVTMTDPRAIQLQRTIDDARLDLDAKKRREQRIRADIDKLQERVEETPHREQELMTLTRDYDNLTKTYQGLLSKKYEAAIARNLEQAQKGERFKLLRPARVPDRAAWPDPLILIPGGVGFCLVLATLMIGVAEVRNPAFRSVGRLTRVIGLPVFASIPRIDNDEIYEEPPTEEVDSKLVVFTAPESSPAEQYRGFLPTFLEAEGTKVILVTSAARGDGKTLTCMNLAVSLASDLGKRVLVIDGDLRRPSAHRVLRISGRSGLSDLLLGHVNLDDSAINSKIPNLSVLPAGKSVRNPLRLMTSDSFFALLDEAKSKYDVVMIDSPPLLPVVDSRILRKMADMVLFVVRADGTPLNAVVRSLQDMRGVAGLVFNQVSAGAFRRHYYYDAYSRYAYGDPPADDTEEEKSV